MLDNYSKRAILFIVKSSTLLFPEKRPMAKEHDMNASENLAKNVTSMKTFAGKTQFLLELVGRMSNLTGFRLSNELTEKLAVLECVLASVLWTLVDGTGGSRIKACYSYFLEVAQAAETEVTGFIMDSCDDFRRREDVLSSSEEFSSQKKFMLSKEISMFEKRISAPIKLHEAIDKYVVMRDYLARRESEVQVAEVAASRRPVISAAQRVRMVLTPSPSKRKSPRRYVAKGATQQPKSNKDKGGKGNNRERKQEAAYA